MSEDFESWFKCLVAQQDSRGEAEMLNDIDKWEDIYKREQESLCSDKGEE